MSAILCHQPAVIVHLFVTNVYNSHILFNQFVTGEPGVAGPNRVRNGCAQCANLLNLRYRPSFAESRRCRRRAVMANEFII